MNTKTLFTALVAPGLLAGAVQATTITFEAAQGYTLANIGGLNGGVANTTTNAPFTGQQGWSLSTSNGTGRIVTTANSGEYVGGQALSGTSSGDLTYIGGLKQMGLIATTGVNSITFDAQYRSGVGVGFLGDSDTDGLFDATPDTGMAFGIGGAGNGQFGIRAAGFGTETFTGVSGTAGSWYRFQVLIGESISGFRTIEMSVRNLTTATNVDLNGAAPGTVYATSVTDAAFGVAPESALGGFVRVSTLAPNQARIDNLTFSAVPEPSSLALLLFGGVFMWLARGRNRN